jgi:quercetin dioxygenase-like cupin family protein
MNTRKNILAGTIIMIALAIFIIPCTVLSQQAGTSRTELQRNSLSIAGREVIQVRVDIEPGVIYPKHSHPGEELVYVLEGLLEYRVEGKPPVTLKAGEVLFIPSGAVHSVKNVGSGKASEIATYIVEKGKPLLTLSN